MLVLLVVVVVMVEDVLIDKITTEGLMRSLWRSVGWSPNSFIRGIWHPRHVVVEICRLRYVGIVCCCGGDGGGRSDRQDHHGRLDEITVEKCGMVTERLHQGDLAPKACCCCCGGDSGGHSDRQDRHGELDVITEKWGHGHFVKGSDTSGTLVLLVVVVVIVLTHNIIMED